MTFILKSVLILIYLSLDMAFGEVVQSEILVWKPWSQIQNNLGRIPLNYRYTAQLGVISVNSWNLNVPSVDVTAASGPVTYLMDSSLIQMKTDKLNVTLQIPSVSIDQTIEQIVGGNTVRVRIVSQCAPVTIANNEIQVHAQMRWLWINGMPSPALENLDLFWEESSWSISDISCSGPMGINSIFLTQLKTNLKNRDFIRSLILEKTKSELQKQWSEFHQTLMVGQSSVLPDGTTGGISLDRVAVWNQYGIGLVGNLALNLDLNGQANAKLKLNLNEDLDISYNRQKALLPKKLIALMSEVRIQKTQIQTMDLRKNDSFMSLLRSRFLQFFLWPDLMNFKKSSKFEIGFSRFSNLTVNLVHKNLAQISGNINAQVNAERESDLLPYIDLAFGFSVNADVSHQEKTIIINAKNPTVNFSYRFNADYMKRYNVSPRLSSTIVKNAKSALVESIKIESSIDLSSLLGNSVEILDYNLDGDNAIIDFQNEYLTNNR